MTLYAIERHSKSLQTTFKLLVVAVQEVACSVHTLKVEGHRVSYFSDNLIVQLLRHEFHAAYNVAVHLAAPLFKLWVGGEEGVNVFHKMWFPHVKRSPRVEEFHVLFHL